MSGISVNVQWSLGRTLEESDTRAMENCPLGVTRNRPVVD